MPYSSADVLATAQRSPAAASARDRDGWVGLFTDDAHVEDPVGSQPHRGRVAIGRFFDTFIGPRDVAYFPDVDVVSGSTVIRDGVLEAVLGPVVLHVPIYIRYRLHDDHGELKIIVLSAFWELPTMVWQFLRSGLGGVPPGLQLAKLLLTNQGIVGTMGFLRGFRGTGSRGKRLLREFLADVQAGDEIAIRRRLGKTVQITEGDDEPLTSAELRARLAGGRARKLIAAGHHVVVGIDHGDRRDVLIADVAANPITINRIRYYSAS
jgi:hypothetical protein